MNTKLIKVLGGGLIALAASTSWAQGVSACGSLENAYGPFDFRTHKKDLEIVEGAHFTSIVETLARGTTNTSAGGDIDYTLRASPNHHRALMAMMNLARKEKRDPPAGSRYTIGCWFDRAERFAHDDAMVKVLHGIFLIRSGKKADAVKKQDEAAALDNKDPNVQYNLGLAYSDVGQYEKALRSAHAAYGAGFPLPGLREKLKRAGKWRAAN